MNRGRLRFGLFAGVALAALASCATPGPTPVPVTPSAPFVCAGPTSVPNFDAVVNEVVLTTQVFDDDAALAQLDQVAAARGGAAVVRCVIDEILPDLRGAPITGVHVQEWEAQRPSGAVP